MTPSNRIKDNPLLPTEDGLPPLLPGKEDVLPPLPPRKVDVPPPLPMKREDLPPPLLPGGDDPPQLLPRRDDVLPPLPSWRDILPCRREQSSPLASQNEGTPPPLPPRQSDKSLAHSVPASTYVKQQEFDLVISPDDSHEHILESGSHRLHKKDSKTFSRDGTVFHSARSHDVNKATLSAPSSCESQFGVRSNENEGYPHTGQSKGHRHQRRDSGIFSGDGTILNSASSSCEGQFKVRSNKDEGNLTATESTPSLSRGGSTNSIAKDHLKFKYVLYCVYNMCVCMCVCMCVYVLCV